MQGALWSTRIVGRKGLKLILLEKLLHLNTKILFNCKIPKKFKQFWLSI